MEKDELLNNLEWSISKELQKDSIDKLLKRNDIDYSLLIPGKGKKFWFNSVELIHRKGYPGNEDAISGLLFLLQDMNWPGSLKGLEILKSFSSEIIKKPLEKALIAANQENDTIWIVGLKILVERFHFTKIDFTKIDLNLIISKSEW